MKQFILFLLMFVSAFIKAENATPLLQQLSVVNAEWKNQSDVSSLLHAGITYNNKTYTDWIATHLMLVEKTLWARDESHLSPLQKQNRASLLNALNGYWKAEVFPINDYLPYINPVFIDRKGTHCAVGYLMMKSGNDALAQQINENEKFAYVRQIKTAGVKEWADKNGFSIDELAWIQPDYIPATNFQPVNKGTNGPINKFNSGNILSFIGNFTLLDSLPCLNVGFYQNNQLNCFGDGVDGTITDIYTDNQANIVVTGNLISNGITYPMATFDSLWHYVGIPGRDGAIGECGYGSVYPNQYEVVISHSSLNGQQEIWDRTPAGTWQKIATVTGRIFSIDYANGGRFFVGQFDSVVTHDSITNYPVSAHNALYKAPASAGGWRGMENGLSDIVYRSRTDGVVTYFGGACSSTAGSSICISRYVNGNLQPLVLSTYLISNQNSMKDMFIDQGGLFVAGDFQTSFGFESGKNIALLDIASNYFVPFGTLNQPVNAITKFRNEWFIGGAFTYSSGNSMALPHFARFSLPTGLPADVATNKLTVYPNPVAEKVLLHSIEGDIILRSEILDAVGRRVFAEAEPASSKEFFMGQFSPGVYILRAETRKGWITTRLIKQ